MSLSIFQDFYRVLNSFAQVGSSAYQLLQLAINWRTNSSSSKSQIFQIFLNGIVFVKDVASETASITELGYERRHFEDLQDYKQILAIANAPPPLMYRIEPFWFHDDSLQRHRAFRGIDRVVQSYQQINKRFEKFQWIGLTLTILKRFQQGHIPKKELFVLFLQEGGKVFKFYAKARCDDSLAISWKAKCLLYSYEAFQFALLVRNLYHFAKKWPFTSQPKVLVIGQWRLVPYKIPPCGDPSLQYEKVSEKYHNRDPFRKHVCLVSKQPVTQALFIYQNGTIFMYEKKWLVEFIHMHVHEVLCLSSMTFTVQDIHIDLDFNANLEKKLQEYNERG